eukprot:SAG31_NODE_4380_length_3288_cov_3.080903_1_plen_76_part_00
MRCCSLAVVEVGAYYVLDLLARPTASRKSTGTCTERYILDLDLDLDLVGSGTKPVHVEPYLEDATVFGMPTTERH